MKQFSLEEYLENPSRKVVTRAGKDVKIHCTNCIGSYPVIAEIEGEKYSYYYDKNGENFCNPSISGLFFAPEKHEGYACVHFNEGIYYLNDTVFSSKEEALLESKKWADFVATVKVEWEE